VTNLTFGFETSPNTITNPMRKMWGAWHIISPPSEKVKGTRPRVLHQIAPMSILDYTRRKCSNPTNIRFWISAVQIK